jgi:hypothetical protein
VFVYLVHFFQVWYKGNKKNLATPVDVGWLVVFKKMGRGGAEPAKTTALSTFEVKSTLRL